MPELIPTRVVPDAPPKPKGNLLPLLERLEQAAAIERRQIARELHDGLSQELAGLLFLGRTLMLELQDAGSPSTAKAERLSTGLSQVVRQLREVVQGIDSPITEAGTLVNALERLARVSKERFNVECRFECISIEENYNRSCEHHLYRIAQEAVSNAIRHGHARVIRISLACEARECQLVVEDDGVGFEIESIARASTTSAGFGLRNMRERALLMGARLSFERVQEGGMRVRCLLPFTGYQP
jgi:two-component system, LuxR family, sensor kinase FixL